MKFAEETRSSFVQRVEEIWMDGFQSHLGPDAHLSMEAQTDLHRLRVRAKEADENEAGTPPEDEKSPYERACEVACLLGWRNEVVAVMEDIGVTRRMLAERIGVDPSLITRFLNGEHNPTLGTMLRIAQALGRDLDVTIKEKDE